MSKQWLQIVAIWVATLVFGLLALANLSGDALYTVFAAIAASAIALVSIEHLISAKAKDTEAFVHASLIISLSPHAPGADRTHEPKLCSLPEHASPSMVYELGTKGDDCCVQ